MAKEGEPQICLCFVSFSSSASCHNLLTPILHGMMGMMAMMMMMMVMMMMMMMMMLALWDSIIFNFKFHIFHISEIISHAVWS